jgi:hypothetical protein
MSYAAIEVELREGHLIARGSEPLPKSGTGLLVILSGESEANAKAVHGGGWLPVLTEVRKRQAARGHAPRTPDAVAQQLHRERESWN